MWHVYACKRDTRISISHMIRKQFISRVSILVLALRKTCYFDDELPAEPALGVPISKWRRGRKLSYAKLTDKFNIPNITTQRLDVYTTRLWHYLNVVNVVNLFKQLCFALLGQHVTYMETLVVNRSQLNTWLTLAASIYGRELTWYVGQLI